MTGGGQSTGADAPVHLNTALTSCTLDRCGRRFRHKPISSLLSRSAWIHGGRLYLDATAGPIGHRG